MLAFGIIMMLLGRRGARITNAVEHEKVHGEISNPANK